MSTPPIYLKKSREETMVIEEYRERFGVKSSASGFGPESSSGGGGGAGGGAPPGWQPPSSSGPPPGAPPDQTWTEAYDEPIVDEQGHQIGVRHNSRTTDPRSGEVTWSVVDILRGRISSETYGSTLPDGSSSYTDRHTAADGSSYLVTRTVEPGGAHGREVTTVVDANGQTTSESVIEW
jgi:hypothetical protein